MACVRVVLAIVAALVCAGIAIYVGTLMVKSVISVVESNPRDNITKCACFTITIFDLCVLGAGLLAEIVLFSAVVKLGQYMSQYKMVNIVPPRPSRAGYQAI